MFNLIRRDVILQKRQLLLFIPAILFFIIMNVHPAFIFLFASIYVPINTYVYDEKTETNFLLNSLPYTRKEIIASRYIGAIVYMILGTGLASVVLLIFNKSFSFTDIAISISLFLLFVSLVFPLFYIFKQGYISSIVLFSFILAAILGPRIVLFLAEHLPAITEFLVGLSMPTVYIGVTLIVMAAYGTSWGFTTFIYQRKVL